MLHIISGVAQSGKTTLVKKQIKETVESGRYAVLIVPEQASFNNERALQQMLGQSAAKAEVLSFSRLAEQLLRQLGGRDRQPVTPAAQVFFMSVALDELSDLLTVYGRHYRSRGFIEQTLSVVEECKNAGLSPVQLSAFSQAMPTGVLREKVQELSLIYDAYEAILHRSSLLPQDMLNLASERLTDSAVLKDAEIYIDDFSGFTAPELSLISALLFQARRVTVALCCDTPHTTQPAFSLAADTGRRLLRLAQTLGIETAQTILPEPDWHAGALLALERATRAETLSEKNSCGGEAVKAFFCANPYDELETVAAEISRLIQQQGYRYRDIAVIARDMARYQTALPSVFKRFNLPFFWDMRHDARCSVLTQGVLSAVLVACGMREADWLDVARSPLFGLEPEQVGAIENYSFIWSLRRSEWERPFYKNPDGMVETFSPRAAKALELLEGARDCVTAPIQTLRQALESGQGGQIARGLWRFLQEIDAAGHMAGFAEAMPPDEKSAFLEEQSLLWQQLIGLLELFDAIPVEIAVTKERIAELIELSFGGFEVATVPRTLDEITVGTADRIRCENVRAVFLLGAIEGEFPSAAMPGGLLSENERRQLVEGGLDLLTEGDRSQATERMFCYRAVTAPTERLVVCCPRTDAAGTALLPSAIFLRAAALMSDQDSPVLWRVWTAAGLEKAIAECRDTPDSRLAALVALGKKTMEPKRVARLLHADTKRVHALEDPAIPPELFGRRLKLSPSRLEQYYRCPFTYYIQKGLGARKRQKAELSPIQAGVLIHRVLERLLSQYGGKGLSAVPAEQLRRQIAAETVGYLAECAGDPNLLPARLLRNFERLGDWLFDMVCHLAEELLQSAFEPVAFELEIGEGKQVRPPVFKIGSDTEILIEGTADRVDTAIINGKKYLRVLDYKSGKKSFLLDEVYYGLNLQMLIYLFSICQNGAGELGGATPAGALYVPAQGGYILSARGTDPYQFEKQRHKQYAMNGLLLSDEDVLRGMERDLNGTYIPYAMGGKKTDALYSIVELTKLWRLVEGKIEAMAQQLYSGDIAALPSCRNGESPCNFCDYRTACGFEPGDPVRALVKLDRAAILNGEGSDDGK
ncbi:MAG TPA: PD-(D/E)XK nuclease family protein [Clostridia bacterium]|nr:PD-(D/E)XK nuclease family protein [Clostridia bacterium]